MTAAGRTLKDARRRYGHVKVGANCQLLQEHRIVPPRTPIQGIWVPAGVGIYGGEVRGLLSLSMKMITDIKK